MKKALLITVDGKKEIVYPKSKSGFKYEELRSFVGDMVEIVPLGYNRRLICHEEGKLIGLPKNEVATEIWKKTYPIEEYPNNNDELIVGDILITGRNLEQLTNERK